jgi:VWFA-related protein
MKSAAYSTLLMLLFSVSVSAQAPKPDPVDEDASGLEEPFIDTVNVTVVNVDVFVTTKKGERVRGLTRDDFEIFEDRQPVEITNFYAIENHRVAVQDSVIPLPVSLEPVDPRLPPLLPEQQRLHLVIYVDNVNIHPLNRQKGLKVLRSFLRTHVGPRDRMMVVSYDRSLNVRQPFTTDKEKVMLSLLDLDEVSGHRTVYIRQRIDVLESIFEADELAEVSGLARSYAESVYSDLGYSLDALKRTVDSLAGLPGRKAIVYISDGIEMRAGADIFAALEDQFDDPLSNLSSQSFDASRRFRTITTEATANRIVIYSLDVAGLRSNAKADVTSYHVEQGTIIQSTHVANLQEPLHFMAKETGGQAIVNTNNLGPMLDRVGEDFSTFYSLGFNARESGTGRFHDVKVVVKGRKGLKVRHRRGYRDQPVSRVMSDSTLAALNFGYSKNDLGIELEFGPPRRQSGNSYTVPLLIKIPMARLAFIPRSDVRNARVRLFVAAKDRDDNTAPVQELPVPIVIQEKDFERAMSANYQLQHTLVLSSGQQLVAIGMRDELGSTTSFIVKGINL